MLKHKNEEEYEEETEEDIEEGKRVVELLFDIKNGDMVLDRREGGTSYYKKAPKYVLVSENRLALENPEHIQRLIVYYSDLKMNCYDDFTSDMKYYIETLEELIDSTPLKDFERDIIIAKIDKFKGEQIIKMLETKYDLKWTEPYLTKAFKAICKNVAKQYAISYEDWFYLNKAKGDYKKCSKCGKFKLANGHHFQPDKTGKMGLRSNCRMCR